MKHSFVYILVPILSLLSVTLCIMCIGTIVGQKLTEGYIRLAALLSIALIIPWQLLLVFFSAKKTSSHNVIALIRVLTASYINVCFGNSGVSYNYIWIISWGPLIYIMTCLETLRSQTTLFI